MIYLPSRRRISFAAGLCVLLAGCEYAGRNISRYDLFLPRPFTLARFIVDNPGQLATETLNTCVKIVGGLLIGLVAATMVSLGGVWCPPLQTSLERITLRSQTLPIPLLSPLLGLLIGYNIWSASVVTALICFFPIYLGWEQGKLALSEEVSLLARSYQPSTMRYIRHILVPASIPFVLMGIKGAINLAILGAVLAEFVGAGHGLGRLMLRGIRELSPATSWATMLVLAVLARSMTGVIDWVQKKRCFSYTGGYHAVVTGT